MLIWQSDLIHLMVEALRGDFTSTHGQWYTAAELAKIMAEVCSALRPEAKSLDSHTTGSDNNEELVNEYYNFLLPAAIDSLLVLANNIHECEASTDSEAPSLALPGSPTSLYIDQFSTCVDSLVLMCTAYKPCSIHSLQSPYLLHLLIMDNLSYSLKMLEVLSKLVQIDPDSLSSLPPNILQSLLDELVYKASSSQIELVVPAVSLLAVLFYHHSHVMECISEQYKCLSGILQRWGDDKFDSESKQFIATLAQRAHVLGESKREAAAASLIQANWRGYCTRCKLRKMHRGIRRFQQLYGQKKALKDARQKQEDSQKVAALALASEERQKVRMKHETQLSLLKQLPATSVKYYLVEEQEAAAIKLQSWWRGIKTRERVGKVKERCRRERSASIIQRGVRRYLANRRGEEAHNSQSQGYEFTMKPLTQVERDQFIQEIVQYQNTHAAQYRTDKQQADLQDEVTRSLQEFYASRLSEHKNEKQRNLLLAKLEQQSEQLLSMPSVGQLTPETARTFLTGSSRAVAKMAEKAHQEELRAMKLPWWERFEPEEELSL